MRGKANVPSSPSPFYFLFTMERFKTYRKESAMIINCVCLSPSSIKYSAILASLFIFITEFINLHKNRTVHNKPHGCVTQLPLLAVVTQLPHTEGTAVLGLPFGEELREFISELFRERQT